MGREMILPEHTHEPYMAGQNRTFDTPPCVRCLIDQALAEQRKEIKQQILGKTYPYTYMGQVFILQRDIERILEEGSTTNG
jgi:hypothetical protein